MHLTSLIMHNSIVFAFVAIAIILAFVFPKYAVHISLVMLLILFLHLFRIVYKMQNKSKPETFVMVGGGVAIDKMIADGYVNKQQIEIAKQAQIDKGIVNPTDADIVKQLVSSGAIAQTIADKYNSLASAPQFSMEALENLASMYRNGTLKVTNLDVTGNVTIGNKLFVEKDVVCSDNLFMRDTTNPKEHKYNTRLTKDGDIFTPRLQIIGNSVTEQDMGTVLRAAENFNNKNLKNESEVQLYVANSKDVNTSGLRIIRPKDNLITVNARGWNDDKNIFGAVSRYYNDVAYL